MGKRKWKVHASLPVFCFLLLSFLIFYSTSINAASPKKKLAEIEKQIRKKKQRIKDVIKKEKSILERIEEINNSIKKKQEEIKYYNKRISHIQLNISRLSKEIESLGSKLSNSKEYLKKRLKMLYKQQYYGGYAMILISASDYKDLIKKSKYIGLIAYHDSKTMKTYINKLNEFNSKKRKMEILYKKLETNRKNADNKRKGLQTDRIKKDKLLAIIRSKRSTYEKTIKELEESSKKLRKMIKRLKKKRIPKSIIGKGFRASRGHLPWPINGKVLVPFGKYRDPKFNIPVFKNGIEIKGRADEVPKAIYGGRVVFADSFKGYGLLLIINHGNGYHSLYGNLSEIFHKTGDIIKKGTAIGKISESRLLNVPTLYFEIRYKGKPIDPLKWLYRKSGKKRKK